jgi:hypothetical protein
VWLERSYHVATLDYDAELVVARTVEFVGEALSSASAGGMVAGTAG